MRFLRITFIFFAYGIALLHTALPHQHNNVDAKNVFIQAESNDTGSIGGFLIRFISTDLGCGHLEDFKSADVDIDLPCDVIPLYLALPTPLFTNLTLQRENVQGYYVEKLQRYLILSAAIPLRAPPVLA